MLSPRGREQGQARWTEKAERAGAVNVSWPALNSSTVWWQRIELVPAIVKIALIVEHLAMTVVIENVVIECELN